MSKVYRRAFSWSFDAPPAAIWPALGDTARFNEAAGIPKHTIEERVEADGTVRFFGRADIKAFGKRLKLRWEELPVEWVEHKWYRHTRLFSSGPVHRMTSFLTMVPEGTGTRVDFVLEATAANLLGRFALSTFFLGTVEKTFTRLADHARAWSRGTEARAFPQTRETFQAEQQARIDAAVARLNDSPNSRGLGDRLTEWLKGSLELDLHRIRPLELAQSWNTEPQRVTELCLEAVASGLLEMRWDLLCPRCRGAKLVQTSLDRIPTEAHCPTCNIRYDRDFGRNVELTFHPAPAIREIDDGEFCLFGPMTTPHVRAQVTVDADGTETIPGCLDPGPVRIRTLAPGPEADIDLEPGRGVHAVVDDRSISLRATSEPGGLRLENRGGRPIIAVAESREWVKNALTAHRALTTQAFRDLFAGQSLSPGDEAGISQVALLFTDLKDSTAFYEEVGDGPAYHVVRDHFALLASVIRDHEGAIVKTIGDAVMAAFDDPAMAIAAAIDIQRRIRRFNKTAESAVTLKLGVHVGPCIGVTLNERFDYFGTNVNLAARLQGEAGGGEIIVSEEILKDASASTHLTSFDLQRESRQIKGFDTPISFHRLTADALDYGFERPNRRGRRIKISPELFLADRRRRAPQFDDGWRAARGRPGETEPKDRRKGR